MSKVTEETTVPEPTIEDYKEAMQSFAVYLGGHATDPRGLLYALDAFVGKTEARFRPAMDAYRCLRAWMPSMEERAVQDAVDEVYDEKCRELTEEDKAAARARIQEHLKALAATAIDKPKPIKPRPEYALRSKLRSSLSTLSRCGQYLSDGMALTELVPELMNASAQVARDASEILAQWAASSQQGDDEWPTEWPTEPGHYWFYGNTALERGRYKPSRLHIAWVRLGRHDELVYTISCGPMFKNEGWQGRWQRIPDPVLPKE
jgi:hypothetical protein